MASRDGWEGQREVAHPGAVAPGALWFFRRVLYPAVRILHRPTLDGIANLPPAGEPFLLVSNHPSGLGGNEFLSFIALYACAFPDPPRARRVRARGLVHVVAAVVFLLAGRRNPIHLCSCRARARNGGADRRIPGRRPRGAVDRSGKWITRTSPVAKAFFASRRTRGCRSFRWEFAASARQSFFRSRLLGFLCVWPRLVGLKRFGLSILAIIGVAVIFRFVPLAWHWRVALAWIWIASPLSLVGWLPTRTRIRIGKPLSPETLLRFAQLRRRSAPRRCRSDGRSRNYRFAGRLAFPRLRRASLAKRLSTSAVGASAPTSVSNVRSGSVASTSGTRPSLRRPRRGCLR